MYKAAVQPDQAWRWCAAYLHIAWQGDGELGGAEHVQGLGPGGQGVPRSHPPDEGALAALAHAKVARIQYSKAHLMQHAQHDSINTMYNTAFSGKQNSMSLVRNAS